MPTSDLAPKRRLQGVAVFLSASVPTPERAEEYRRIPEAPLRIEEAVVSVARAIFIEGGTLVFGGHPSISPLVARVVDHYYLPAPAEKNEERPTSETAWKNPSVVIYQSRVWEPYWAETTERLSSHPLVHIQWIESAPDEKVDIRIKDRPLAPASMEQMRRAMIKKTSPAAMIAIGGMRGVFDEAEIFAKLRPGAPIFTLATTGGAAALLAEHPSLRQVVQTVDAEAAGLVRKFWENQKSDVPEQTLRRFGDADKGEREFYVPYAFIAQQIADLIATQYRERSP